MAQRPREGGPSFLQAVIRKAACRPAVGWLKLCCPLHRILLGGKSVERVPKESDVFGQFCCDKRGQIVTVVVAVITARRMSNLRQFRRDTDSSCNHLKID